MSIDQLLFAWIKSELDIPAVTGIISGDNSNTAIIRDDYDQSFPIVPRVEYNPWRTRSQTLGGAVTLEEGIFGITVAAERGNAFGGSVPENAGNLHNLLDAVQSPLIGVVPILTGLNPGAIKLAGVRRSTLSNENIVSIRLDFSLKVYDGLTTPPISGGDGDLDFNEIDGTVVQWTASPDARHDTQNTGEEDLGPIWEPNDPTNRVRVWFMPEPSSQPMPLVGSTVTANFDTNAAASWTQSLKLDRYTWPQDLREDGAVVVIMDFVDDDFANSPWLGA